MINNIENRTSAHWVVMKIASSRCKHYCEKLNHSRKSTQIWQQHNLSSFTTIAILNRFLLYLQRWIALILLYNLNYTNEYYMWFLIDVQIAKQLYELVHFDDWSNQKWQTISLRTWIFNWWKLSTLKNTIAKLIKILLDRSFALSDFTEYFIIERVYFLEQENVKDIVNSSTLEYNNSICLILYRIQHFEWFEELSFQFLVAFDANILNVNVDVIVHVEVFQFDSCILVLDLLFLNVN